MKKLHLSDVEKAQLEHRHRQSNNSRECDRIKAVLLRSENWTISQIAQALRLHESTIDQHLKDCQAGKLSIESGGSESLLNEEQTQALIQHLEAHTYHHVHEIIAYVKSRWSVAYSVPGMNKWLHRNGFSYKKPKGHPHKFDEARQREFIEQYEELKATAGPDAPILFMDAVHPTQATKVSYGWIRTGQEKHVETTASRTRINLVGAIQLGQIGEAVHAEYATINSDSIVDFMGRVREAYKTEKQIHLILDGAGYHRSEAVAKEAERLGIKLHFLPPYSPNLNPIERLWKVMNEKVRNNRFFKNAKDFKETISHFFEKILPDIGPALDSRINDNFQLLKN